MSHVDAWILPFADRPDAALRLVCFPYAGGAATVYREFAEHLPAITVCPVQLPGRGQRIAETPCSRLGLLIPALADSLGPLLGRPYALFGHSVGALIAFELARELRRRGAPAPVHLFVSAFRAPHLPGRFPPIHRLPAPELLELARQYNGLPAELAGHGELLALLLPALRADLALSEDYHYTDEAPLGCDITALGGLADRVASRDELAAWRAHTTAGFALHRVPGHHLFIHSAQARVCRVVAAALTGDTRAPEPRA